MATTAGTVTRQRTRRGRMRLGIEGTTLSGDAIDLRERQVDADALRAAIRGEPSPYTVECPDPGPLHARIGAIESGLSVRPRRLFALAARSLGHSAPQDDRIAALRRDLAAVEIPEVPATPTAPPAADVDRLRERVAELRGEVNGLEATGRDPDPVREQLRDAAGRLAELETERAARAQASEALRAVRDARERRFRLEDRIANAEREARAHLADRVRPRVADAVADLVARTDAALATRTNTDLAGADADPSSASDDPREAPPDVLALAVLRVARVSAPVPLAVDRFRSPAAAAAWLDAPVVRL